MIEEIKGSGPTSFSSSGRIKRREGTMLGGGGGIKGDRTQSETEKIAVFTLQSKSSTFKKQILNFVQGCTLKLTESKMSDPRLVHRKVGWVGHGEKTARAGARLLACLWCSLFSFFPHLFFIYLFFFTHNPLWLYPSQPQRASLTGNPRAEPRQGDANSGTSPSNHSQRVVRRWLRERVCGLLTAPVSINHNSQQMETQTW